jgi:iron complex outermembrane receptor protein
MPDAPQRFADTVGYNSAQPLHGSRTVGSGFGELRIPITSPDMEVMAFRALDVTAALRYDYYSDFGGTWNPKVNLRWEPVKNVTLRGSYSTSFRAPTFGDLYLSDQESYPELRNPARAVIEPVSSPYLDASGNYTADPTDGDGNPHVDNPEYDPASNDYVAAWNPTLNPTFEQIKTVYQGNPNLEPETAENFTAGVVYSPEFAKRLALSVDWFKIDQENVPGSVDQFILDTNYRGSDPNLPARQRPNDPNAPYADLIAYNPANTTYQQLTAPTLNLSRREIEGLDFRVSYQIPTENVGDFLLSWNMTYYYRFQQEDIPGQGLDNRLGDFMDPSQSFGLGSIPYLKMNLGGFWNISDFEFGVIAYYVGGYRDDWRSGFDRDVSDIWTVDLQASYNFPHNWRLTVGVENVADTAPPLVVGAFADNYDRDTHSLMGRFVYGQISKKW